MFSSHMTDSKQAKGDEKAASMSQMTEVMAPIQKMLLEMQPQLSQLIKEVNEIKESQQQQIAQLNKKIEKIQNLGRKCIKFCTNQN